MAKIIETHFHSGFAVVREQFSDDGRAPFETVSVYSLRKRKPDRAIACGFVDRAEATAWIDRCLSRQFI
jgi:hypothetical protein